MAISSALGGTIGAVPVGSVTAFAGSTAPSGWLLCFGQAISRTQYSALFSVVGTTYGTGDGSTTFNLPDLRGRIPAGKDDMGGSAASRLTSGTSGITGTTLGAAGGDERVHQHTHVQNSHNHTVSDPTHAHGVYDPSHAHTITTKAYAGGFANEFPAQALYGATSSVASQYAGTGIGIYGAYTGISNVATTATNQNFGSGSAQNVQPTIVLNYIIRI